MPDFLKQISQAFDHRISDHGDTAAGVLWKNPDGQLLRFELLAGILDAAPATSMVSINDLGCGYGALLDFLDNLPGMLKFDYAGYDISKRMIETARRRTDRSNAGFHVSHKAIHRADYSFVSGTYNLKLGIEDAPWRNFVCASLADLWSKTGVALAFNMLDARAGKKADGLYYAESADFMNFARSLSGDVTLIDDYPLEEWTIYLKR